jgi:hypothetical protein
MDLGRRSATIKVMPGPDESTMLQRQLLGLTA